MFVTISLAVASVMAAPVFAQETCGIHTVVKGKTLRNIALQTYGNAKDYRYIFDANRSKFGISPHIIRIGQDLELPCRGSLTTDQFPDPIAIEEIAAPVAIILSVATAEPEISIESVTVELNPVQEIAQQVETDETPEELTDTVDAPIITVPDIATIRLVGFADNTPYSDASLLHGGLITTPIETALLRSKAARVDQPTFVFRTESGLATSVLPGDFHLSFPWLLPDCKLASFDADIRDLCDNYTFSAPIYEAQMAMYKYDLLQDGMIEPIISLETATDLAKCFEDLRDDIVDIVSVNGSTADVYFAKIGQNEQIVELTERTTIHTVHAIARNDNPAGLIAINYLNAGLWDMLANGEWGEVSKDYLMNRLQ